MPSTEAQKSREAVRRILEPRSVAIIGMSSRPGSAGISALGNLVKNGFTGDIHLVGRSGGEIEGRPVATSIDDLPEGIDLAIFALPAAGAVEAMEDCVRRKVGAVVIFASGFAEIHSEGEKMQARITELVRESGISLVGPNCLGLSNSLTGLAVGLLPWLPSEKLTPKPGSAVAVIGQSGGLVVQARALLTARGVPVTYYVTTGNEAGVDLADFVHFLTEEDSVGVITLYTEQIKRPGEFLSAVGRARAKGKHIVMMHPGRSEKGQRAFQSHTGSLTGNHAAMRARIEAAGVLIAETLEEWHDVSELLARFPTPPTKGIGLITFSGALCGITQDYAEDIDIEFPEVSPEAYKQFREWLPDYVNPGNPLDMTTAVAARPELVGRAARAMLDDPNIGSVSISIPFGGVAAGYTAGLEEHTAGNDQLLTMTVMNDGTPIEEDLAQRFKTMNIPISYSPERTLRAVARIGAYGRRLAAAWEPVSARPFANLPPMGTGTMPEWQGKEVLAAIGIAVPSGGLATTLDEAIKIAADTGYPVALKAQSTALSHKTEAGGVLLGIKNEDELRVAWDRLSANIDSASPGLKLDGVLVEGMAEKGVELAIGARRDADWGPVLMIGLGGIWIEAIGDVRLMTADASPDQIRYELLALKTSKLLQGFRGAPPADIDAVVEAAALIGRLMMTETRIMEIDINPLAVHAEGRGLSALDALIVLAS